MFDRTAEDICEAALQRSRVERADFVAEACGSNAELRAEVESLLEWYAAGHGWLEREEPWHRTSPAGASTKEREHLGELGPYEISRELGRGGQGTVYLARDRRLDRDVALKVLPLIFSQNTQAVARLQREAKAASKLDHPGVATVYEAGEIDGIPYLAMRLVDGHTLRDAIANSKATCLDIVELRDFDPTCVERRGPSSESSSSETRRARLDTVLTFFEETAIALHAAHEAGLVHRDLKPGNLAITKELKPVILDFGLARDLESDLPELTRTGDVLGTPTYMAPEQISPGRGEIDAQSDVYSLGAALYESLTLSPPFSGQTRESLFRQILAAEYEPVRVSNPSLPTDVGIVVETALEMNRSRRYNTALDVAAELRRIREHRPIQARKPGAGLRLRRWARRNPAVAGSLALVLLVLLSALGASYLYIGELRTQARELRRQTYRASITDGFRALSENDLVRAKRRLDECPNIERNWEWFYLRQQLDVDDSVQLLTGHDLTVRFVGFQKATQRVFAVDAHSNVRTWNRVTGEQQVIDCPERLPNAETLPLAVHADGTFVLSARAHPEQQAFLWNALTGEVVQRFPAAEPEILGGAIRNDGAFVTIGTRSSSGPRHMKLYATKQPVAAADRPSTGETFTSDGSHLLLSSGNAIESCSISGSPSSRAPLVYREELKDVATSTSGSWIAAVSPGHVVLWDGRTGQRRQVLDFGAKHSRARVTFRADEKVLAAWIDNAVELWEPSSGDPIRRLRCQSGSKPDDDTGTAPIGSFSWEGTLLATPFNNGSLHGVRIWDTQQPAPTALWSHDSFVYSVAFSPDGSTAVTGDWSGEIRLWDAKSGTLICTLEGHTNAVRDLTFDPSGERLLSASLDEIVEWDLSTGFSRPFESPGRSAVTLDQTGTPFLARDDSSDIFGDSRVVVQCSSLSGERIAILGSAQRSWNPHGGWEFIEVRQAKSLATVARIEPSANVYDVAFSPTDRVLAAGDHDGNITLWDATGKRSPIAVLSGHEGEVFTLAFLNGRRLVSGGRDGTIRIWDVETHDELVVLREHGDYVYSLAVSPDGTRIVSGSGDSTVRIWETTDSSKRKSARAELDAVRIEAEQLVDRLFDELSQATPNGHPQDIARAVLRRLDEHKPAADATLARAARFAVIRRSSR